MSEGLLQFVPFQSRLEAGFWHELSQRKLEKYQLSEDARDIVGYYTNSVTPGLPTHLTLEYNAFEDTSIHPPRACQSPGAILNTNTLDSFKTIDKKKILEQEAQKVWKDIVSGAAVDNPSLLTRFFLLTFADLKKFNFYYWFAFPALFPEQPITMETTTSLDKAWNQQQLSALQMAYDDFRRRNFGVGYFLVKLGESSVSLHTLREFEDVCPTGGEVTVGFCDPSTLETNPGWPLRNFLMLIVQQWGDRVKRLDVLCYRDYTYGGRREVTHSLLLRGVKLPPRNDMKDLPKFIGWERNEKNKLAPKVVNLSASMDPARLAESSVDLNLKLMRWRLMPTLDLQAISQTRCLLLGSGTLGCNVARCLMGWGVRHITLLDNSTVSYSNPVRQSLFQFQDCVNGGKHKAIAAAERLRLIFPGVHAEAVDLSIPMPGHSIGTDAKSIAKARSDVQTLEKLVSDHDAVFLLMDTRESRWLPTVLCATKSKICINAALGFDTYMVMRHGFRPPSAEGEPRPPPPPPPVASKGPRPIIPGSDLGCYFCSDVVAPTDSTRDRTLDQQCTVSRPGLSMIASALAAELLVSVLQHPKKGLAPADTLSDDDDEDSECPLGLVPHQIRGFLSRFHNVLPASRTFDKCTACSDTVLTQYQTEGFDFLLKVFNSPDYLEELTGLSKLYAEALEGQVWELSDDDF